MTVLPHCINQAEKWAKFGEKIHRRLHRDEGQNPGERWRDPEAGLAELDRMRRIEISGLGQNLDQKSLIGDGENI